MCTVGFDVQTRQPAAYYGGENSSLATELYTKYEGTCFASLEDSFRQSLWYLCIPQDQVPSPMRDSFGRGGPPAPPWQQYQVGFEPLMDGQNAPMMEMRQTVGRGWRGSKPIKVNRRRILCPTLPSFDGSTQQRLDGSGGLHQQRHRLQKHCSSDFGTEPMEVSVRMLYFSHDGSPADTGAAHDFTVPPGTTVDALLGMARRAAGVGNIGRLMFKGKPLPDGQMPLESCGVSSDPKALHLMLARKFRPSTVAEAAAAEAAELATAMAQAEAEFRSRPPRQKRRIQDEDEHPMTARSDRSTAVASSVGSAC